MKNDEIFLDGKLSDTGWFQKLAVSLFNNEDGKYFLEFFNTVLTTNSLSPANKDEKETIYRDGFFHLIREINVAKLKYSNNQQKKEVL